MSVVLIAGVSGIVGCNAAQLFLSKGWKVLGISRNKPDFLPSGVIHYSIDLLDAADCDKNATAFKSVTAVIFSTWTKGANEQENCKLNGAMLNNLLSSVIKTAENLQVVSLVTGTKHYLGPFESYGITSPISPFKESFPRLQYPNFYYDQENILMEKAEKHGFKWTVARPHSIFGFAPGNLMNIGTTIAVYATLCKRLGLPFVFPGSKQQYTGITDVTDADLLAEHLYWEVTSPQAGNQAFNVANGDIFRWNYLWKIIADYFKLEVAPLPEEIQPLQPKMSTPQIEKAWEDITKEYNLKPYKLSQIAVWWHADADLGRTFECINDMNKSKELGFVGFRNTEKATIQLFDKLHKEKIIPPPQ